MIPSPDSILERLRGRLVGISDRALAAHLDIYGRYIAEANAIEREYRRLDWTSPSGAAPSLEVAQLYGAPIAELKLDIAGVMADELQQLRSDLAERDIAFFPSFYLGDQDFWTTDRATSINIPWFLANPAVWEFVNEKTSRFSVEEIRQIIRHETGHALNYAFQLYQKPDWRLLFGNFDAPYRDVFVGDPSSRDFVRYLDRAGMKHYAQKHPDEDFAETFATWLDGDWEQRYMAWPGALRKLQYVDVMAQKGAFSGQPDITDPGERIPYTSLTGTVAEFIGLDSTGWSPHSALLRREPEVLNAVALHAAYFENLGAPTNPSLVPRNFFRAVEQSWGSRESYMLDLRAIAGSTNGWAVTVWDPLWGRVRNALVEGHNIGNLAGCSILMALDTWEHNYAIDYGIRKDIGIGSTLRNIDWSVAEHRLLEQTMR